MAIIKIREDRARRQLSKQGFRLCKTPSRSWLRGHYGPGYMIVESYTNTVVLGCANRAYDGRLEDVERFALEAMSTRR